MGAGVLGLRDGVCPLYGVDGPVLVFDVNFGVVPGVVVVVPWV